MLNPHPDDPLPNVSWLLQLRDAAKLEPDEVKRYNLKMTADKLQEAMEDFEEYGTFDTLLALNGLWTYSWRLWFQRTKPEDTPGGKLPIIEAEFTEETEERKAA